MDIKSIYDQLRGTEMNDWVGGSDPEIVGDACFSLVKQYIALDQNSRVLDFGCGIGRVALALAKRAPAINGLVGFDIMPQVIDFCRTHITPAVPWASFELVAGSNDHYDEFIRAAGQVEAKTKDEIQQRYAASFTGAYAFSVFTHLEQSDFARQLAFVRDLMVPGGEFMFTCFLLTPYSRRAIAEQTATFAFDQSLIRYENDGQVFIGDSADRLGFIAFDTALVEQMVLYAGLVLTKTERGAWTGSRMSASLQDIVVCRRPLQASGELQRTPTVARASRA